MSEENILVDRSAEGLLTVTLNRPEKANSLTTKMLERLVEVFSSASDAQAVILTGRGRVFSAGADLDEARAGLATSPIWEELSGSISSLPCFKVAALNGTLAGGANGMALACDLRIAVSNAQFFYPVMSLGYHPQPSDVDRLKTLIGPARAKMMLMAGQKLNAQAAYDFGCQGEC